MLTQERLKFRLNYDPLTGLFSWKTKGHPCSKIKIDGILGCVNVHGYIQVKLDNKHYLVHRLAWLYVYGKFPDGQIDHIDHNKTNNRIKNLRDVSHSLNQQNILFAPKNKKHSKLLGACFHKQTGKFRARIRTNGIQKHLGAFDTAQEAHQAYLDAKRKLHSTCTI